MKEAVGIQPLGSDVIKPFRALAISGTEFRPQVTGEGADRVGSEEDEPVVLPDPHFQFFLFLEDAEECRGPELKSSRSQLARQTGLHASDDSFRTGALRYFDTRYPRGKYDEKRREAERDWQRGVGD